MRHHNCYCLVIASNTQNFFNIVFLFYSFLILTLWSFFYQIFKHNPFIFVYVRKIPLNESNVRKNPFTSVNCVKISIKWIKCMKNPIKWIKCVKTHQKNQMCEKIPLNESNEWKNPFKWIKCMKKSLYISQLCANF